MSSPESPRVRPRVWMALPAVIVVLGLSLVLGPLLAVQFAPADNQVLLALIALAVVLIPTIGLLAFLGWLRPVFLERRRVGGLLPTLLAFAPLIYIVYCAVTTDWSRINGGHVVTALLLASIAGVGEELAFRGVAVVTLRARLSEVWVALIPSVVFSLAHLLNLGGDVPAVETFYQVFYAFLFGLAAYALRRVTGGLFIPILVHTLNNGFENLADATGGGPIAVLVDGAALPDILFIGGLLLGTVATILIVRNRADEPEPFPAPARL